MRLKDGGAYTVPPDLLDGFKGTYLKCDVMAEMRAMAAWLESNPTKRKTRTGMPRFINAWLKRADDSGGSPMSKQRGGPSIRTRDLTAMQDLTMNFTGDPLVTEYFLEKYGECFDGKDTERRATGTGNAVPQPAPRSVGALQKDGDGADSQRNLSLWGTGPDGSDSLEVSDGA